MPACHDATSTAFAPARRRRPKPSRGCGRSAFADVRTRRTPISCGWPTHGVTLDLLARICEQFAAAAPRLADPDMALNNLERFICSRRAARWRRPRCSSAIREALPNLLQIFTTSQHLSDLLVADPESYDLLRMTEGQPVARDVLVEELVAEVRALQQRRRGAGRAAAVQAPRDAADRLRRHRRRTSRSQRSRGRFRTWPTRSSKRRVDFATRQVEREARHAATAATATPPRFVVLGLGKLGGVELNYSSDIDLVFLYDRTARPTPRRRRRNGRSSSSGWRSEVIRLLTETTDLGFAYRVDLRLRPEGRQGPLVHAASTARCRTTTCAAAPGSGRRSSRPGRSPATCELGKELLAQLEPWIYRRYLSLADITGIKALKRRIEQRAEREGGDAAEREDRPRRHSRHRVRDSVPATAQRRRLPEVRTGNTLDAIARLEAGRLPDAPGTHDARRQLQLPAQARASAADHVRSADARAAERAASELAQARRPAGLRGDAARIARSRRFASDYADRTAAEPQDSRPPAARRLSRRRARPSRKSTWSTTPTRRRRRSSGCWAAIRSATCRRRTRT